MYLITVNKKDVVALHYILKEHGIPWDWLLARLGITGALQMTYEQYDDAIADPKTLRMLYDADQEIEIPVG